MNIVNLTKRSLSVYVVEEGKKPELVQEFPSELGEGKGKYPPVEVKTDTQKKATVLGIDIMETTYTKTVNLPKAEADTYLIVPKIVAEANPKRPDLIIPDGIVRDGKKTIGVTRFVRTPKVKK